MTTVRRLQAAAAFTAAVVAATCWQISDATSRNRPASPLSRGATDAKPASETGGMFANRPVVRFTTEGESFFAWQMKADLPAQAARPRDLVVVVDTSASQAGLPLQNARMVIDEIIKQSGANDRIAVWTVSTPEATKDLTRGLRPAADGRVADAVTKLERTEYAAGASDLKAGLAKAVSAIAPTADRRVAVLYLGDGDSVLSPINESERNRIAADLNDRQIGFFAVPLGTKINAKTIHGLSSATGGLVIRFGNDEKPGDTAKKILGSVDAPVIYPTKSEFGGAVVEALPNRLPPLRSDAPTLVAGKLIKGDTVACTIEGQVAGRPVTLTLKDAVPASEATNFFLINLVRQWSESDKSAPAVMRADRGLALAYEQTRLARDEFLTQANWALGLNKLDAAERLFENARAVDPNDAESAAGAKIVGDLKSGKIDRATITKTVQQSGGGAAEALRTAMAQDAGKPGSEPASGGNLLELEKRRRTVQEQQLTQIVDEAIRQARVTVKSDPDAAYDLLKRQLASVRDNGDLSDGVRSTLANRLEASLRTIQADGARVKLEQDAELRRRIALDARRGAEAVRMGEEERIRERVRLFGSLMDRARYEEAYKESLELQRELTAKGRAIPPQVHAAYVMNTNATNIRDYEELRRVKEERFLLTMLQVDKSHVPFPDEPPVAFPAASFWREITELRKDRYSSDGLGGFSRRAMELRDKLARPVTIERAFDGVPLKDVMEFLSDRYELTILINPVPFKETMGDVKIEEQSVRIPKMPGVSLSTLLSFALSQVNATYLIRKDYVEITTRKAAGFEKTVRAYPVADLVIPIPNAVDQLSLQQNLQVLGSSLSANGQAIFGAAGGGLNLGNFGVGGFGAGGGGLIQFGGGLGGGLGGGGQTFLGGGNAGLQGGALGFAGGTLQNNLGFGGGVLGFGGGQQGQFGNLGGQFGLQGGDTSNILIRLIEDTIAPKEWNTTAARYLQINNLDSNESDAPPLDISLLNSMGYYQPSRALVVRGSARIHTRIGDFSNPTAPAAAARPQDRPDVLVFTPKKDRDAVAAAAPAKKPEPAKAPEPVVTKKADRDVKKVWHESMAAGQFKPRNVIAVAEVLAMCDKFDEAAELLKADLRHGVLAHPCVFDALAVALQGSGASVEEVERARLSKIDLDAENPQAYLDVAAAMVDAGRADRAIEFTRRAAALEPNAADAYQKTLAYADKLGDAGADAIRWAASNLLRRDWGSDDTCHQQAKFALEQLASRLAAAGKADEAVAIKMDLAKGRERDLMIEAIWSDPADVDLVVNEPVGTVCSVNTPRTPAGGMWNGDRLGATAESYVAAQAFSGSYEITARRIWGNPMGNKVTVKVTKHQGTANEAVELHTLVLDAKGEAKLKVNLVDGRRTQSDAVPVAASVKRLPMAGQSKDDVYAALRQMADPMLAGARPTASGSSANGSLGETARNKMALQPGVELTHQTKVAPALTSGIDLLTKTTISSDRSTMTISLAPAFDAVASSPRVPLAAVPGGK